MSKYNNDNELFSLLEKKLFPAVVGDVLDKMGYLHQFLPAEIQPLEKNGAPGTRNASSGGRHI